MGVGWAPACACNVCVQTKGWEKWDEDGRRGPLGAETMVLDWFSQSDTQRDTLGVLSAIPPHHLCSVKQKQEKRFPPLHCPGPSWSFTPLSRVGEGLRGICAAKKLPERSVSNAAT